MAFDLRITTGSSLPIYRQIVDQVRLAIAGGALVAGEQLPSVRALAERLLINPNTVAHAYAELSRHGLIESAPGRGAFVAERRRVWSRAEQLRRIDRVLDALVSEMAHVDLSRDDVVEALDLKLRKLGITAVTAERAARRR
jgi:GntR family transcriptional regulator